MDQRQRSSPRPLWPAALTFAALVLSVLAVAVGYRVLDRGPAVQQPTGAEQAGEQLFHPDGWRGIPEQDRPGEELYDPTEAGEPLPVGYRELVGRDKIRPVYVPNFVKPDEVEWSDEELVIGVFLEGEARAYPVEFLSHRDTVVDRHRGIPTFVTW